LTNETNWGTCAGEGPPKSFAFETTCFARSMHQTRNNLCKCMIANILVVDSGA
jgi:hypothetical protein